MLPKSAGVRPSSGPSSGAAMFANRNASNGQSYHQFARSCARGRALSDLCNRSVSRRYYTQSARTDVRRYEVQGRAPAVFHLNGFSGLRGLILRTVRERLGLRVMSGTVKQVLVIEDNPDDLNLLLRALSKFRLRIMSANTGQEALSLLYLTSGRRQELPDLIFLDLYLPGMHGFDILRQIRGSEWTKDMPVVVVTSSVTERDALKSYSLGAAAFLPKPVQVSALIECLDSLGIKPHKTDEVEELVRD